MKKKIYKNQVQGLFSNYIYPLLFSPFCMSWLHSSTYVARILQTYLFIVYFVCACVSTMVFPLCKSSHMTFNSSIKRVDTSCIQTRYVEHQCVIMESKDMLIRIIIGIGKLSGRNVGLTVNFLLDLFLCLWIFFKIEQLRVFEYLTFHSAEFWLLKTKLLE